MNGGSNRPEEEREDVTGLMWGNNDGCAEVLHLEQNQEQSLRLHENFASHFNNSFCGTPP